MAQAPSKTPIGKCYRAMMRRCYAVNDKDYPEYGGRGITVCKRWRDSFEAFKQDMGERPPRYSIERIDNNKGYSPKNCKWASFEEQNNNRRNNKKFTFNGETLSISQWARKLNLNKHILWSRFFRQKLPVEQALTMPKPADKELCPQGHPYSGDNLIVVYRKRTGGINRLCRICCNAANKRSRAKRRLNESR